MKGFCIRCGEPLALTDKICPNCGMPVEEEEVKEPVSPAEKPAGQQPDAFAQAASMEDTAEIPVSEVTQVMPSSEEQPSEDEEDEKVYVVERRPSFFSTLFYLLLVLFLLGVAAFGYCYFRHPDYIDIAMEKIGVHTNFARNVEVDGTYGLASPEPSTEVSPAATEAAAN